MSKKQAKTNDGLDLVTPFAEILTEIIKILTEVLVLVLNHFFRWLGDYIQREFFGNHRSRPVTQKQLRSKKKAVECKLSLWPVSTF